MRRLLIRLVGVALGGLVDVVSRGGHDYFSTHCRHLNHARCKGCCKTCAAPCVCPCHPEGTR